MMHRNHIYPFVKNCNVASFCKPYLSENSSIYILWMTFTIEDLSPFLNDSGPKSFLSKIEV